MLISAEFIKCRFLKHITGDDHPLLDTGLSFFRYVTSAQEFYDDPNIRPLFENQDDEICFFHNFAAGTSIVTYRCEGGRARAINVFARRPPSNGAKAGKKDSVDGTILHEIDPLKIEAPEPLDPIFWTWREISIRASRQFCSPS